MEYQFNEQELKARKKWLFATKLYYFAAPVLISLSLVCLLVAGYMLSIQDCKLNSTSIVGIIALVLGGCVIPTIFYFIMIRCAYKKPGTKLLTCLLVFNLFSMLGQIAQLVKEKDPFLMAICLPFLGLYIFWATRSFKLRSINKKVQSVRRKAPTSTEEEGFTPPPVPALG